MIRIDEIYYNVFVKALQHHTNTGLHWFDPFGSVRYQDMCSMPKLSWGQADKRIVFWDQEPVYFDTANDFFGKFAGQTSGLHYDGAKTIVVSERNSRDLDIICDTYKLDRSYYFFHGWAALDWYRGYNHSFLHTPWMDRDLQHRIFCPNNIVGGNRKHRLSLISELDKRNLINGNLISFPDVCPYENQKVELLMDQLGLPSLKTSLPLIIDHNRDHSNNSHRIDFWEPAQKCFCHVVTETVYGDRLHLTEKIFKPIVLQQPFILVGSRLGLAYLKEYGFRTFDHIWDESYDDLPDQERIQAIANLCETINGWNEDKLRHAQQLARDTVEHNFNWFYGGFQDVLWKELLNMIDSWQ